MIDELNDDLAQWRANRHLRKAATRKAKATALVYAPHPDPVLETARRIDAAAELIAPVLTDGVLLQLIKRTLAAGRLQVCGCLDATAADTVYTHAFEREFAAALRSYIIFRVDADQAVACVDCHRERCPNVKGDTA